jgi:AraC-like DNA-binding protein
MSQPTVGISHLGRITLPPLAATAVAVASTSAFHKETGMTFGKWRQQLRLLHALKELAAGKPVTSVALEVGYESPSAFIAMFRRTLGTTPFRYFAAGGGESRDA